MGQLRGPISSIIRRRWVYHWGHRRTKSTLGKKKDSASVPRRAQVWVGWDGELLHSALESFQLPPCPSLLRSLAHEASRGARPREPQQRVRGQEKHREGALVPAPLCGPASGRPPSSTKVTAPLQAAPPPQCTGSANNLQIVPLCPF